MEIISQKIEKEKKEKKHWTLFYMCKRRNNLFERYVPFSNNIFFSESE